MVHRHSAAIKFSHGSILIDLSWPLVSMYSAPEGYGEFGGGERATSLGRPEGAIALHELPKKRFTGI